MDRLARGWALVGASWHILVSEPLLAILPVLGVITSAIAGVLFALPLWLLVGTEAAIRGVQRDPYSPETLLAAFGFYLVTSFCTLFFNTALAAVVLGRLRGQPTTIGQGLGIAASHTLGILGYAAISATVGLLLRTLEERQGLLGQIVLGLVGAAWSVVTFLVVPVMVAERVDPFTAIRRSGGLLKQTWGEQIAGNLGVGLVFFLLALPAVAVLAVAVFVGAWSVLIPLVVLAVLYFLVLAVVGSALGQIFRTAVYVYAATGQVPAGFAPWMLQGAFRPR